MSKLKYLILCVLFTSLFASCFFTEVKAEYTGVESKPPTAENPDGDWCLLLESRGHYPAEDEYIERDLSISFGAISGSDTRRFEIWMYMADWGSSYQYTTRFRLMSDGDMFYGFMISKEGADLTLYGSYKGISDIEFCSIAFDSWYNLSLVHTLNQFQWFANSSLKWTEAESGLNGAENVDCLVVSILNPISNAKFFVDYARVIENDVPLFSESFESADLTDYTISNTWTSWDGSRIEPVAHPPLDGLPTSPIEDTKFYFQDADFSTTDTWTPSLCRAGAEAYAYILDGKLKLKSQETTTLEFSTACAGQGLTPFHWTTDERLLGGENLSVASPTPAIVFRRNDPIPEDTYFLDTRVRWTDRGCYYPPLPLLYRATLGLGLTFQYEWVDGEGYTHLSDYFNPRLATNDEAICMDLYYVFFDCSHPFGYEKWNMYPSVWEDEWTYDAYGNRLAETSRPSEFTGCCAKYDNAFRVCLIAGEMPELGVWHTFHWDMRTIIDKIWEGIDAYLSNPNDPEYMACAIPFGWIPWHVGWRNVTAIILRGAIAYSETSTTMLEGEFDYIRLGKETCDVNVIAWTVEGYHADQEHPITFYKDSTLYCTPTTITLPKPSLLYVTAEIDIYIRERDGWVYQYKFYRWVLYGVPYSQNPLARWIIQDANLEIQYEYVGSKYYGGGGSGGRIFLEKHSASVPIYGNYGWMHQGSSGSVDNYLKYLQVRQTLGNINGTISLDVYVPLKLIRLDTVSIKKVVLDLGKCWVDAGRSQWFNPWSSYKLDDITCWINIDNVSRCEIVFQNVPNVMGIQKNMIDMEKGEFWDYIDGDLHLYMTFGDPEIFIDFETVGSIAYEGLEVIAILLLASLVVVMIKKWKF